MIAEGNILSAPQSFLVGVTFSPVFSLRFTKKNQPIVIFFYPNLPLFKTVGVASKTERLKIVSAEKTDIFSQGEARFLGKS